MERWRISEDEDLEKENLKKPESLNRRYIEQLFEGTDRIAETMLASVNIAYLAGITEDAHLGQGGKEGYVFDVESKSERWLTDIVMPALKLELPEEKEVKVTRRGTRPEYRIQVWDKDLVETLRVLFERPGIVRLWSIQKQRAWVRGLADAEGSATRNTDKQPQFSFYNKDFEKLKIAGEILEKDGIHFGFYLPQGRDVWQMYLTGRENLKRFLDGEASGVSHPEKRSRLLQYLAE